jgi:glycosyltransferase involved in cell wall biosynthesis
MKVTVIPTITAYPWGAPGHCMGALVDELLDAGHEVQWFVAPIDLDNPEVQRRKVRCARFGVLPPPAPNYLRWAAARRMIWSWRTGKKTLADEVDAFNPDHIFVNQGGMLCGLQKSFAEVLQSRAGAYSLICHLNQEGPPLSSAELEKAQDLLSRAKAVFVNSSYMRDLAKIQLASNLPNARHYHLPHRFDFPAPLPWPAEAEAKIAFVGRLDAFHKGLDLALCALRELRNEGLQFRFTLFGDGPDRDYLGRLARYLGLGNEVIFAGYADGVQKVWEENEILLMPSRHEGCAVAMTEAIGFGRPIVSTAVGGAPEWIEEGVTGFLAAAPSVGLVAEALRRAMAKRDSWRQMGEVAHRKFKATMPERPARVFLEALSEKLKR